MIELLVEILRGLPPGYGPLVTLMFIALFMAVVALIVLRIARRERLPLGVSSDYLLAVMVWLVCLLTIMATALLLFYVGTIIADPFRPGAN